jgi:hypothetical protein
MDLLAGDDGRAARRSSIRAFVQEPMKTRSTEMSCIAVPARGPCR